MALRWSYLALIAVVLAAEVGCCCARNDFGPYGHKWCGGQCGEFFWNEWFSIPPCCCDPCDDCNEFCGNRRDSTYSNGMRKTRYSQPTAAEPVQAEPVPARAAPTEREPEPYTLPGPSEEMPSGDSSTGMVNDEFSHLAGNEEPVDSRPPSRTLETPRRSHWRAR